MIDYDTLTKRYNTKDAAELLAHLKNDVDSLRGILRRIAKLKKAGEPMHNFFHYWILRNANDIQTHAAMLYEQIEKEEK